MFEKIKGILTKLSVLKIIANTKNNDRYSDYPSEGLTPQKLARIFKEADSGDVLSQMELFEEMEEKDTHLFSQLQTRKNAVTGLDYEIKEASAEENDKKIAEFVREQFQSFENFEDVMTDLLDAIGKGISFIEIIWDIKEGKFIVKDLKYIHPKNFFWDYEDNLKIRTDDNPSGINVPENKFIIHKYKAKSGHPSRAGVLRITAWMYLFKNYTLKDWVSFLEVYGMPLRIGKYDQSASEDDKKALMEALISLGTDAAGIYPTNTEIELKESSKQSSAEIYEKLARFCDEQMSKCILGQTLTSDSGGGSYAQSKTHNEVRHDLTAADCKALASTIRRDLISPLVKFNFGENAKIPYIAFDFEESEDLVQTANVYDVLINKIGIKIPMEFLYRKFKIPKPEKDEDIAEGESINIQEDAVQIANKSSPPKMQNKLDSLVNNGIKASQDIFAESFEGLKKSLKNAKNLDELKSSLENKEEVTDILKSMNNSDYKNILKNSMLLSDLMGRVSEDE